MNTFRTSLYKEHAIQSCYYCGQEQIKVLMCLTPGNRYAYRYFKSILAAKQAITKHINKGN
jgi:hypothetical protein